MQKNRSLTVDLLKCFAIVAMILGHSLAFGCGSDNTLGKFNPIHHYIYSIHMPLFAMISGYLFYFSVQKRSAREMFQNRVESIIVPLISWQFVMNVFRIIFYGIHDGKWDFMRLIKGYSYLYGNMWFLWSMLFCSVAVIVVHYFFKDSIFVYLLIEAATFLISKDELIRWVWLYPYFVLSYFFAKHKNAITESKPYKLLYNKFAIAALFVIHFVLVCFWKMDYYIYDYGYGRCLVMRSNFAYALICNIYRFAAGAAGSLLWLLVFKKLSEYLKTQKINEKLLCYMRQISKYTLGIYIFSVYFLDKLLACVRFLHYNIFVVTAETLIILIISVIVMNVIEKNKYLNILLLGGR